MTGYEVPLAQTSIKGMNASIAPYMKLSDALGEYVGQLVWLGLDGMDRNVPGRLIEVCYDFITLQQKDGRLIRARKAAVSAILPMRQEG